MCIFCTADYLPWFCSLTHSQRLISNPSQSHSVLQCSRMYIKTYACRTCFDNEGSECPLVAASRARNADVGSLDAFSTTHSLLFYSVAVDEEFCCSSPLHFTRLRRQRKLLSPTKQRRCIQMSTSPENVDAEQSLLNANIDVLHFYCGQVLTRVHGKYTYYCSHVPLDHFRVNSASQPIGSGDLNINTFTAIVDLSRFNNSCLKSPASTLVDLTFQLRALRFFSLNQLCNLSLQAGNLHSSFSISS